MPAKAGSVGGVVRDQQSLAVLRDESSDVHLDGFEVVIAT